MDPLTGTDSSLVAVSNVIGGAPAAAAKASGASAMTDVVYVALGPGTVPDAQRATIRNARTGAVVGVPMLEGGFDPVALNASVGDTVVIDVHVPGRIEPLSMMRTVPARRRPVIVRIDPPPRKRDVPLNASIVVIFSEPIDGGTLTASAIRLMRGASPVPGSARVLYESGPVVVFTPEGALSANTDYLLEVTDIVRDVDGDRLEAGAVVEFTTGESLTGEPASIQLAPDSILELEPRWTYEISPTVRDAAGNVLTNHPVTWTSDAPAVATVTAVDSGGYSAGRVTAIAEGSATITATAGSVTGTAVVTVNRGPPVTSIEIEPDDVDLPARDSRTLTVTALDANGDEPWATVIRWSNSNPEVVSLARDTMIPSESLTGYCSPIPCRVSDWNLQRLVALAEGTAMLIAAADGVSDTAFVTVGPPRQVASLALEPSSKTLLARSEFQLMVTMLDGAGAPVWPTVTWTVDDESVAIVDAEGMVTAVATGTATVTASAEGFSASTQILVLPELNTFVSISASQRNPHYTVVDGGGDHRCGVTPEGWALCWGQNGYWQLGNGNSSGWPVLAPAPVEGGLTFSSVNAGTYSTCGVTTTGAVHCWGDGVQDSVPVLLPLDVSVVALDLGGYEQVCALATDGKVYCWSTDPITWRWVDPTPAASPDGVEFIAFSMLWYDLCAVTANGVAYCRSFNRPWAAVDGGHTWVSVEVGEEHVCGLTDGGAAYCWGAGGKLGNGTVDVSTIPVPVAGGHTFVALSSGNHSCAITDDGAAYCWGDNQWGQLGDGTTTDRLVPTPVLGGHTFASISAGAAQTCAIDPSGIAYCWGRREDRRPELDLVPTRVPGQP